MGNCSGICGVSDPAQGQKANLDDIDQAIREVDQTKNGGDSKDKTMINANEAKKTTKQDSKSKYVLKDDTNKYNNASNDTTNAKKDIQKGVKKK